MTDKLKPAQKRSVPVLLKDLRNVGRAALEDFKVLGISTIGQLAQCDAEALYLKLQRKTKQPQDPCVWDVFAATIHQARTGEALDWWKFTPARRELTHKRLPAQRVKSSMTERRTPGRRAFILIPRALFRAGKRASLSA